MNALERWAEAEGNKPTSLATFLLEQAIRSAVEQGKVPPEPAKRETEEDSPRTIQSLVFQALASEWSASPRPIEDFAEAALMDAQRVRDILDGDRPTNDDVVALSRMVDWSIEDLTALVKQQYNGNGNRQHQNTRK